MNTRAVSRRKVKTISKTRLVHRGFKPHGLRRVSSGQRFVKLCKLSRV